MYHLELHNCQYLNQLVEQLGNIKSLKVVDASDTTIQKFLDSIVQQKNWLSCNWVIAVSLKCYLNNLGIWKEWTLDASSSAIRKLLDSFVALNNLVELKKTSCVKLRKLPNLFGYQVIWNIYDCMVARTILVFQIAYGS